MADLPGIRALEEADRVLAAGVPTLLAVLAESRGENERLRDALRSIAQYDPRWEGQHVNDMPSRAELIARAYDALAPQIDPS